MGNWYINNIDLKETYGLSVEKSHGWYDIPKRKKSLEHSWREANGTEVDLTSPTFEDLEITLDCYLVGYDPIDLLNKKNSLTNLLASAGHLNLYCVYYSEEKQVYYKSATSANRFGRMAGNKIFLRFSLTFVDNLLLHIGKVYSSQQQSKIFFKNDCEEGHYGSPVEFIVPAGKYTSVVSQEAADNLAIQYLEANGQAYANSNGTCITGYMVINRKLFRKQFCPDPEIGSPYEHIKYYIGDTPPEAQAALEADRANFEAQGQAYANETGYCRIPETYIIEMPIIITDDSEIGQTTFIYNNRNTFERGSFKEGTIQTFSVWMLNNTQFEGFYDESGNLLSTDWQYSFEIVRSSRIEARFHQRDTTITAITAGLLDIIGFVVDNKVVAEIKYDIRIYENPGTPEERDLLILNNANPSGSAVPSVTDALYIDMEFHLFDADGNEIAVINPNRYICQGDERSNPIFTCRSNIETGKRWSFNPYTWRFGYNVSFYYYVYIP